MRQVFLVFIYTKELSIIHDKRIATGVNPLSVRSDKKITDFIFLPEFV